MIARGQAGPGVHHQDDDVSLVYGASCLLSRVAGNFRQRGSGRLLLVLQSGGVDDGEFNAGPLGGPVDAVPSRSWLVLHDRLTLADEAVEQGRLADVRSANDGYNRSGHAYPGGPAGPTVVSIATARWPLVMAAAVPPVWEPLLGVAGV